MRRMPYLLDFRPEIVAVHHVASAAYSCFSAEAKGGASAHLGYPNIRVELTAHKRWEGLAMLIQIVCLKKIRELRYFGIAITRRLGHVAHSASGDGILTR